jgi:hypothetical protein
LIVHKSKLLAVTVLLAGLTFGPAAAAMADTTPGVPGPSDKAGSAPAAKASPKPTKSATPKPTASAKPVVHS